MFARIPTSMLFASTLAAASNITFFLSKTTDTCSMDGVGMSAPENTAHGSLCAYDSDSKRIWACPAPDSLSALATATSKPTSTSATTTPNAASASATSTTSPPSSSGSLSGGAIAGVVIGALAGVVLIASAAFFVYRRQMEKIRAGLPTELHSTPYEEYKYQQQGYYDPPVQRNETPIGHQGLPIEMAVEETVHEMSSQTVHK
ncbi:hypothetical protein AOQ84DRAFT_366900 [Glonium stellatum]|uniref:Uncharacterized protein n=1 Tax=Glonium stellatum TaxID=574774 RepID=A0A8E2JPT6_9PEZI|nr:hypothetical protein AOQ84DRAFT_366900 [Glonium stellatum]